MRAWVFGCFFFLIFGAGGADAQISSHHVDLRPEDRDALLLPTEIPPLPSPDDPKGPIVVNAGNVSLFHELLLAPVAVWIKEGKFSVKVVRNLNYLWQLSPAWRNETSMNPTRFALDDRLNLTLSGPPAETGYPFGFASNIDQEPDEVKRAYKILWNSQYTLAPAPDLLYDIELGWLTSRTLMRSASGIYFRRFFFEPHAEAIPSAEAPGGAPKGGDTGTSPGAPTSARQLPKATPAFGSTDDLMFQEMLRLTAPPVVFGLSEVSWRYRTNAEDLFWIYSPVIGRSRKVFGSNRSDPLLGGLLAYDDMFVAGAKVQSVKARVVAEKVMLLPFPQLNPYQIVTETDSQPGDSSLDAHSPASSDSLPPAGRPDPSFIIRGYHKRPDSGSAMVLWNFETGEYPRGAHWFPTTTVFVPRRVWIVEGSPRDPFYLGGRRVVVIDKESMLPFYKIVYAQNGDLQKLIMGGWALGGSETSENRFPFLAFTLAVDARGEMAASVTTHSVKVFPKMPSKLLADLERMLDVSTYRSEGRVAEEKPGASTDEEAHDDEAAPDQMRTPAETPFEGSGVDTSGTPDEGGF